jgi:hypothetical protein
VKLFRNRLKAFSDRLRTSPYCRRRPKTLLRSFRHTCVQVSLRLLENVRPSESPKPHGRYHHHFSPVCAEPLFKRLENRRVGIGPRKGPRRFEGSLRWLWRTITRAFRAAHLGQPLLGQTLLRLRFRPIFEALPPRARRGPAPGSCRCSSTGPRPSSVLGPRGRLRSGRASL